GLLGEQHGAVVVGDVERRADAAPLERLVEATSRPAGQIHQARVEQGGVLPLEKADPPELMRAGDGQAGALLLEDARRLLLARRIERREDGCDADRAEATLADPLRGPAHRRRAEGQEGPAAVLVPT